MAQTQINGCSQMRFPSIQCRQNVTAVGKKVKKGKDVDLYSAFHAQGTSNVHVTETDPPGRYLGHRLACKHSLGSDPITGTGSASQLVGLHLRNPSLTDHYSFNRPRRDGWLSWPCWLTDSGTPYPQSGHTAGGQSSAG